MNNSNINNNNNNDNNKELAKCPFCKGVFSLEPPKSGELRHDMYPHGCPVPLKPNPRQKDSDRYTCYSCGITEGYGTSGKKIKSRFTKTQRSKGSEARCKTCVSNGRTERFYPYAEDEYYMPNETHPLFKAVYNFDVDAVQTLLEAGADPNIIQQDYTYDHLSHQYMKLWKEDGSRKPMSEDKYPANRPILYILNISGFIYVGDVLTDEEHPNSKQIIELLLNAGADLEHTLKFFERKWGMPDDEIEFIQSMETRNAHKHLILVKRSVENLLKYEEEHGLIDYEKYFTRAEGESNYQPKSGRDNGSFFHFDLPLTIKAVESSQALQNTESYKRYALKKIQNRLRSQVRLFQSKSLPEDIEVHIRSLAITMGHGILASQVPPPLT